jgi:hypothetical protein
MDANPLNWWGVLETRYRVIKNKYAMYSSFGDHTEILPKEIFAIDPPNQRKEIKF